VSNELAATTSPPRSHRVLAGRDEIIGCLEDAFRSYCGADRVDELHDPLPVSEDFGSFGSEWGVPSLFRYVGSTDPDLSYLGR
jgi:hypothetical protein